MLRPPHPHTHTQNQNFCCCQAERSSSETTYSELLAFLWRGAETVLRPALLAKQESAWRKVVSSSSHEEQHKAKWLPSLNISLSLSPSQLPLRLSFSSHVFFHPLSLCLCRGSDCVCVSETTNRNTCSFSPLMSRLAAESLPTLDQFREAFSAEAARPGRTGRVLIQTTSSVTEPRDSVKLTNK